MRSVLSAGASQGIDSGASVSLKNGKDRSGVQSIVFGKTPRPWRRRLTNTIGR